MRCFVDCGYSLSFDNIMLVSIKEQTFCEEANSQSGKGKTGLQTIDDDGV